jgi:hypothetical protein
MLFPKRPLKETQTMNTPIGILKWCKYTYEVPDSVEDDNFAYLLAETEFPDTSTINSNGDKKMIDKFLKASMDGGINGAHDKLVTEQIIEVDGYPGRFFRAEIKDGREVMTIKTFLVKNKLYMMEVITATKKDFNKSLDQFFHSFVLKQ